MSAFLQRIGLTGGFGGGGPAPINAAETETFVVPGGHGSSRFEVTTLNGIELDAFNTIVCHIRGLTQSGGTGLISLFGKVTIDGGLTWEAAGYYSALIQAFNTYLFTNTISFFISQDPSFADMSFILYSFNVPMRTSVNSAAMSVADNAPWHVSSSCPSGINNGFRLYVTANGGTPVLTGGNIEVTGYR